MQTRSGKLILAFTLLLTIGAAWVPAGAGVSRAKAQLGGPKPAPAPVPSAPDGGDWPPLCDPSNPKCTLPGA